MELALQPFRYNKASADKLYEGEGWDERGDRCLFSNRTLLNHYQFDRIDRDKP